MPAELFRPEGSGPFPGVAVGQEATGPNAFIRRVGGQLAEAGYMALVPDYYHGAGPADPDDYDDIAGIFEHMAALDFRQATYDLMAAADHLKAMPEVDAARLAVWGYCTGATMALLTASLRADLSAAVLLGMGAELAKGGYFQAPSGEAGAESGPQERLLLLTGRSP